MSKFKSLTRSVNGDEQFRATATAANEHHVTVGACLLIGALDAHDVDVMSS